MLQQLLQAWKAQPASISVLSANSGNFVRVACECNNAGNLPSAASALSQARSPCNLRHYSRSADKLNSQQVAAAQPAGPHAEPSGASSFLSTLRKALFPIGPKASEHAAGPTASSAASSAAAEAQAGLRAPSSSPRGGSPGHGARAPPAPPSLTSAASAAQRRAARPGTTDAFASMSGAAEGFSGALLKAAVLLITVPLGVHMLSHSLMVSLCVRGLDAPRSATVITTLRRVRDVVRSDYLAQRFEAEEGVVAMMGVFREGAEPEVLREWIATASQLLQFPSTREGLLMFSVVERLERALGTAAASTGEGAPSDAAAAPASPPHSPPGRPGPSPAARPGWLPAELREAARQLYLDAHAARRMGMEGAAAG